MPRNEATVLVLGGGIIGVTSAYFLARAGLAVTLVERRERVGLEASYANGALITPAMSESWAAPGMPLKLLRWIGRGGAPFLVHPSALPGLMSWGLEYIRNCTAPAWRRNSETNLRLAQYSKRVLQEVVQRTGIQYDRNTRGSLKLFQDKLSTENALRGAELLHSLGVSYRMLDADQCVALEPALAVAKDAISGGIHFPEDEAGDAYKFTTALSDAARQLGVNFHFSTTIRSLRHRGGQVTGVETNAGELTAQHYLLAAGWEAPKIVRGTGVRLPIYPVKGYSVTFSTEEWEGAPTVPLLDDGRKVGIVRLGDRLRVVGTAEFAGSDTSLNDARLQNIARQARALFPHLARRSPYELWAGMRPTTPDGVPFVGRTQLSNLFVNVGHGHLGWTMACGTSKAIADIISGEKPEIDLAAANCARTLRPTPAHPFSAESLLRGAL